MLVVLHSYQENSEELELALCSWGHVTTIFLKILHTMDYSLKNARNGKSILKI